MMRPRFWPTSSLFTIWSSLNYSVSSSPRDSYSTQPVGPPRPPLSPTGSVPATIPVTVSIAVTGWATHSRVGLRLRKHRIGSARTNSERSPARRGLRKASTTRSKHSLMRLLPQVRGFWVGLSDTATWPATLIRPRFEDSTNSPLRSGLLILSSGS